MPTVFVNLPTTASNGAGAAVDVSTMGGGKTIVNFGNGATVPGFDPNVTIEVSNDVGGTNWSPVVTFQGKGETTIGVACHWIRAVVSNYRGGAAPTVDVGGDSDTLTSAVLVAPAVNGDGASVNTSALSDFKTVQVAGTFRGTVNIKISENGTDFVTAMSFQSPGVQSGTFTAKFMLVSRNGVPDVSPGLPVVNINATTGGGGGGGGGATTIVVQDEGVVVPNGPFSTLNFTGGGVTASDGGGGIATINVPSGATNWQDEGVAILSSSTANFVGAGVTLTDVAGVATVTIPGGITGVAWQEEGAPVVTSATANFVGPDTTVTNVAGVATVTTKTNPFSPPEQWAQLNVAASQTNVQLSCQVSTNFDDIKMMRSGSVVGLATRLTEAIAAGTLTVEVIKNGAAFGAPFTLVHTNVSNQTGGIATATPGSLTYVAGDLLAIRLTTTAGFLPVTTDLEAWLECVEAI